MVTSWQKPEWDAQNGAYSLDDYYRVKEFQGFVGGKSENMLDIHPEEMANANLRGRIAALHAALERPPE
jgi:hypothetical protein